MFFPDNFVKGNSLKEFVNCLYVGNFLKAANTNQPIRIGTDFYVYIFLRVCEFIYSCSANICLFQVNNRNTRKRCEICSKFTKH